MTKKRRRTERTLGQSNDSKGMALSDSEISSLVSAIEGKNAEKWRRFWECKIKGMNTYRSAKGAGFSESYSRGDIYRDLKPGGLALSKLEQILAKAPETARKITQLRMLTDGLAIDGLALNEYKKDPRLAITNPQLLKHLRQVSGMMAADSPQVNIDFSYLRQLNIDVGQAVKAGRQVHYGDPDSMGMVPVYIEQGETIDAEAKEVESG